MRISDWSSDVCSSDLAESEVSWFQTSPRQSLDWILPGADPATTAIIDIGGGASRLVDELLDRSFADVTVLDIADSALAQSRKRLGDRADRVRWIVADITAWSPPRQYDVWSSEEHPSELQSLMRISYAVFCLKKKTTHNTQRHTLTSNST